MEEKKRCCEADYLFDLFWPTRPILEQSVKMNPAPATEKLLEKSRSFYFGVNWCLHPFENKRKKSVCEAIGVSLGCSSYWPIP